MGSGCSALGREQPLPILLSASGCFVHGAGRQICRTPELYDEIVRKAADRLRQKDESDINMSLSNNSIGADAPAASATYKDERNGN